jgi:hypothetical protein
MFIYSLSKGIIVISRGISSTSPAGDQGGLCLGGLGLLLVAGLLLLQLLVTSACKSTCNLLNLIAVELFDKILGELLKEETVVSLLGVGSNKRRKNATHLLKLQLRLRVENRDSRKVDEVRGVFGIGDHGARRVGLSSIADTNASEKIFGVLEIGVLFSGAKSLAASLL